MHIALCWLGLALIASPTRTADDAKPGVPAGTVTVLYRGKTHTLTGKPAEDIRATALELLSISCEEIGGVDNDNEDQARYKRMKKRSHILITFDQPVEVPKAGNNKIPVLVRSLLVPFSPDLDPETVYVLPGKPFRPFMRFNPDLCDPIREALVEAKVYPADSK